jgi:hypothetical protein
LPWEIDFQNRHKNATPCPADIYEHLHENLGRQNPPVLGVFHILSNHDPSAHDIKLSADPPKSALSAVKKYLRGRCASARESFVPHFSVHAMPRFIIRRARMLAHVTQEDAVCTMGD